MTSPNEPSRFLARIDEARAELEIDLDADLDDLIRRELEVLPGVAGVAREEGKKALLERAHSPAGEREDGVASEEVRDVLEIRVEAAALRFLQDLRYVRALHEAIATDDAIETARELL